MVTPTFQIVTDEATYTQGDTTTAFKALGHDTATLQSYDEQGTYLVLAYEHGMALWIPETRVKYIAEPIGQ